MRGSFVSCVRSALSLDTAQIWHVMQMGEERHYWQWAKLGKKSDISASSLGRLLIVKLGDRSWTCKRQTSGVGQ
jgi:hypothetical protein